MFPVMVQSGCDVTRGNDAKINTVYYSYWL